MIAVIKGMKYHTLCAWLTPEEVFTNFAQIRTWETLQSTFSSNITNNYFILTYLTRENYYFSTLD